VKNLSFPRLVGTPGEKIARDYIEAYFHGLGLEVELQGFRFTMAAWDFALRIALLVQSGLLILAAWLFPVSTIASASICAVLLIATSFLSRCGYIFEVPDREGTMESANVIAREKGRPQAIQGAGKPTVVFMAHYDTKAQTFPLHLRYVLFASGFLMTLGLALTMLVLAFGSARPHLLPWALVSAIPNILLQFNRTTNASNGAVDNGSGIGVLLELARMMTGDKDASRNAALIFAATGAEEVGMIGAIRFIKTYGPSLDPASTYIVNLDGPGAKGNVVTVTGFGIPPHRTCRRMRALARKILGEKGLRWHDSALPIGAGLDSLPISARGYEAISIASGALSKSVFSIHSKNDRLENVDPESLRRCGELAAEIALRL